MKDETRTETRRNAHPGACTRCGARVAPDAGTLRRVEREDGYRWADLTHDECPEEPGRAPEVPRWAVPAEGRTPGGNRATGVAMVDGARPSPDAAPVNDAARAELGRDDATEADTVEAAAMRTAEGRRWLAYWWLRGIRSRPAEVTMDTIDEMLDGADVAAMDAAVGRHRAATLAEYGHTEASWNGGKPIEEKP